MNIINWRSSKTRMMLLCFVDIFTVVLNSYLSLIIRHEMHYQWIPEEYLYSIRSFVLINIIITIVVFIIMNLYNSVWSFAGVNEAVRIVAACTIAVAVQALGMQLLWLQVPRSYYIFDWFLLIMTTGITRFSYRGWHIIKQKIGQAKVKRRKTMVIGAGEAGSMIIQELKTSKHLNQDVTCVIDDNPSKKGKFIHGIKIVGNREEIKKNVKKYNIDDIILAIPSAKAKDTKEILGICSQTDCKLKVLPGMYQLITEEVSVSKLREVSIEDLLGRESINIDLESVSGYIKGRVIMVTGGGGSIGAELCRQIAEYRPKRLIIFDIYENSAYEIQQELLNKHPELKLDVLIGSVRNTRRVESVIGTYRPEVIYHAAAHKHVPLMEDSPTEAIKNNVFGTYKTARAADKYGVKRFVLISTDKAVNPTNIMGASKRICEMVVQTFDKYSRTEYVAVRFGNVLGSNGSVIPLFKKQIEAGGPVTVTHPDIIRYFMTIPEAVALVIQAGAYAKGGEIFVLDMGEPVRILDLAKNLIRLSGYTLGVDMEIEFTGLRPGEKLYEELLIKEEGLQKTRNKLIYVGHPIEVNEVHFLSTLRELELAASEESENIKDIVAQIVPTYHIRSEDKVRMETIHQELCGLGQAMHESNVVEEKNDEN